MTVFNKLRLFFANRFSSFDNDTLSAIGYNLWSASYDNQPDNLMLALDEILFADLIKPVNINGAFVADVGCGTGRHWKKLFEQYPKKLIGFDVSPGMLNVLQEKYPNAETHILTNNFLSELLNESCDLLISTLTIAHIENLKEALNEWGRVLKPGGSLIITDFHPTALAKGGKRTFTNNGKLIALKNYVHTIVEIRKYLSALGFKEMVFTEKRIDKSVKHYYEKQNALKVFEAFEGTPVIYGITFKK